METHSDPAPEPERPGRPFTANRMLVAVVLLLAVAVGAVARVAAQTRTARVGLHAHGTGCLIDNPSLIPRSRSAAAR